MKKLACVLLALLLLLSLSGCGKKEAEVKQDESSITVLISSSGNSEAYFRALAEKVKQELGIEIEFIFRSCGDSTFMTRLRLENNEVPADVIFTASQTSDEILSKSCLDLIAHSSVTAYYTQNVLNSCTTEDGKVYQLPISSKLIGITYNETLLNEMGWSVPGTFEDMLDLKAKCDAAGIKFAVSDGIATGHGFNWLFHLMGAQWLSTPNGTEWLYGYLAGTKTIDEFKEHCEYFKKWTEAGLWGSFHNTDWNGGTEFSRTRALFWFGLTNTLSGYDGPQYDEAGNETGTVLHDTYKTIPWISETGTNNCYTKYDNCWVSVNKSLEAADKSEKLEKVLNLLEYLASDSGVALVTSMAADNYVGTANFVAGEDRLYANYNEDIRNGFLQTWFYNDFDSDSIVFTGEKVNAYIAGTGTYEDIFTTLDICTANRVNSEVKVLTRFTEALDCENTAKLIALSTAAALDKTLEENGREERAEVSLVPYLPAGKELQPWATVAVENSVIFAGDFDASCVNTLIPNGVSSVSLYYLTGAEIKAIVNAGFDPSDRNINKETGETFYDLATYGTYPYACLVKGGAELEDGKTYLTALCEKYLPAAEITALKEAGKELTGLTDPHSVAEGISLFINGRAEISKADLAW